MCLTCGCLLPNENHGDQRNITMDALKKAAEAQNISVLDALKNLIKTIPVVVKNWKNYATK